MVKQQKKYLKNYAKLTPRSRRVRQFAHAIPKLLVKVESAVSTIQTSFHSFSQTTCSKRGMQERTIFSENVVLHFLQIHL